MRTCAIMHPLHVELETARHIKWSGHRNGAGHDGFVRGEERPEEFGLCLYGFSWRENCVSWRARSIGVGRYFIGEQVSVYSTDRGLAGCVFAGGGQSAVQRCESGLRWRRPLLSRRVTYVSINGVFPGGPIGGFHPQPIKSVMTAVEYLWSEQASFTLQFA